MDKITPFAANHNSYDLQPSFENPGFVIENADVSNGLPNSCSSHQTVISVHDIGYVIRTRSPPICGKIKEKTILSNITAIFPSGMNAIMGPTGCGKSTLLDIISDQKNPVGLTGTLLINGLLPPNNFKCQVGFVEQDDVIMGTLSVKENLNFSASLRLPSSLSSKTRKENVNSLLEELGLTEVADSKVGTEFIRGISGGERKRTCIGMELIISPDILFLDEPTTGLDANTAYSVMCLLKKLSEKGKNIIFSIHQPRYSIYNLFDNMTLLCNGVLVFHGHAKEALSYFENLGFKCEEHNNPADFFLDVISKDIPVLDSNKLSEEKGISKAEKLKNYFAKSTHYESLLGKTNIIEQEFKKNNKIDNREHQKRIPYNTTFLKQLLIVSIRALKNLMRNPASSTLQAGISIVFAIVIGLIYFQLDDSKMGLQNRNGVIFFIIVNQMFSSLSALELFIKERLLFIRENSRGFYRCSTYFVAKVTCDILPMRLFPVTLFSLITYWMMGFKKDVAHFFLYYLTLFLTTATSSCLSFAISSSVTVFAIANSLIALAFVFMMLFSGLLININSLNEHFQWIQYLSLTRFGIAALSINELKDMTFCPYINGTKNCSIFMISGNTFLEEQAIMYKEPWDFWENIVGLTCMSLISLVIAYIKLLRINKMK